MMTIVTGDMLCSTAQTLVNPVNCAGAMGKGLALQFRQRFPEMYENYRARCVHGRVHLGTPYLYRRQKPPWIVNFPTKLHWRSRAQLAAIQAGLEYLRHHYQAWGITSLAVPALGCGEGGLMWSEVEPVLVQRLDQFVIPVELYRPV